MRLRDTEKDWLCVAVRDLAFGSFMPKVRPILLFDVMDTLVAEPFFEVVPTYLGMSAEELYPLKDGEAWVAFEHGQITEAEYEKRFFKDRRTFDLQPLKALFYQHFAWLSDTENLLSKLKAAGYEMHALSNYPVWYEMIEAKLKLSRFLSWRFVSCRTGVRKPDPLAYLGAAQSLNVEPKDCLFIDDRKKNIAAAENVGMPAILRTPDFSQLLADLRAHGVKGI